MDVEKLVFPTFTPFLLSSFVLFVGNFRSVLLYLIVVSLSLSLSLSPSGSQSKDTLTRIAQQGHNERRTKNEKRKTTEIKSTKKSNCPDYACLLFPPDEGEEEEDSENCAGSSTASPPSASSPRSKRAVADASLDVD
jgi:hypothetical protein